MNHRLNGQVLFNPETGEMLEGIEHDKFEKVSDTEYKLICENLYPCSFDKGILKSVVQRFNLWEGRWNFWKTLKADIGQSTEMLAPTMSCLNKLGCKVYRYPIQKLNVFSSCCPFFVSDNFSGYFFPTSNNSPE